MVIKNTIRYLQLINSMSFKFDSCRFWTNKHLEFHFVQNQPLPSNSFQLQLFL